MNRERSVLVGDFMGSAALLIVGHAMIEMGRVREEQRSALWCGLSGFDSLIAPSHLRLTRESMPSRATAMLRR